MILARVGYTTLLPSNACLNEDTDSTNERTLKAVFVHDTSPGYSLDSRGERCMFSHNLRDF